ncbi:MaoC/PaaZ C-terminal domain-containing protein [Nocardioides sp. CER19]|uniref:MaoC family dehydratase n=1 Tax=Nocardioides sp. CER19 TaxID=3038538 RepID=UPI002446DE06|nr:MaoC/PaaZ C-terminal domain-containing protein [Nocardioides sp. CER19]MDH2416543.1 MaoC/PaaZ C-terminal domain-containing protein [Nocardioides sp. CER19]
MTETRARVVSDHGGLGTLVRAALPSVPGIGSLPGVRKTGEAFERLTVARPPVTIQRPHVEAYAEVCGFPVKDTAPLTYPHLLAFPLHMALMTDPAFPAPAMGMVHLENSITQHRPLAVGESLGVSAWVGPAKSHPKGEVFEFVTSIHAGAADGELVWESTSAYLRRGQGDASASRGLQLADVSPGGTVWRLPGDLGRRYAAVSGDYNPIHLFPLTAKALGFKRQIAHGMWTKARSVAALENRLPDAVRVDVAFRKPVFLPGKVAFGAAGFEDGYAFSLTKPGAETVHLLGRTTAL